MARIQGINDRDTLRTRQIKPSITVWKGAKKSKNQAGKSLENLFRIEAPAHLRAAISKAYGVQPVDNSIYVPQINLISAYENPDQTFDCKMASFTASRPVLFCDRLHILTRFIDEKSPSGGSYFSPRAVQEPCPVANTNFECPNSCSRTGDFYFYIYELILLGYSEPARLQVHGIQDIQNIAKFLDDCQSNYGSIKKSPFVSEDTHQYVIYQMTRRLIKSKYPVKEAGIRTSKRGTKDDWIVNLSVHPIWLQRFDCHQQAQNLIAQNYQPSQKLIEQVHGEGLISSAPTQKQIAPAPSKIEAFKEELAIAYKNNGWTKAGWLEMMKLYYGSTVVSEDLDLDILMAIAKSGEEKNKFCGFKDDW